jgi:heme-degrading monooxygenase HmoA
MFVVMNRVHVTPEWEERVELRFSQRQGQIEKNPGFVRMHIMRPQTPETPYVIYMEWENKPAFENWVASEDFKLAHAKPLPKEAFAGGNKLEQHEVFVSSDMK